MHDLIGGITFNRSIGGEDKRHRITSKLHRFGINSAGPNATDDFIFNGYKFFLSASSRSVAFRFNVLEKLKDKRLSEVVQKLFDSQVLCEYRV